eukprot:GHVL01036596.1.p1 GENE.GHVL01036596.1~~GHVL01036596.1.p1  ORF type:complete len:310 (-),score=3.65 GHVL01036596.1:155-1084(-)
MGSVWDDVKAVLVVVYHVLYYWLEAIVLAFVPTSVMAKDIAGQTVLITGAGSGIGRLLALEFATHNCRLALWDVNSSGNQETALLAKGMGATVRTYTVDVSYREQVYSAASKVTSELGHVDILVNNAGIVTGQKFLDCPDSMIDKTMQVNTMAHFWTVKAFLPAMLSRNHGHVVSVASSAGLLGVTGLADYCSSKFGAVGFDESLRFELKALGKDGVHTTVVCPYLISTGMFNGCQVKFPWLLNSLEPEVVSEEIIKAVLRNQEFLILPRLLYIFMALKGLLPVKCVHVLSDYMGASHMMDTFKGRKSS